MGKGGILFRWRELTVKRKDARIAEIVRPISYLPGMKMRTSPPVCGASRSNSSAARSQIG
jgi:hypothetical protein